VSHVAALGLMVRPAAASVPITRRLRPIRKRKENMAKRLTQMVACAG
jgi:hypothetical protein